MRNKFMIGTILTSMLLMTTPVEAMGNAKVEFFANDKIEVGDTFTVNMSVTDIKDTYDGIVSMGGNLSFDSNMIEYVSSKGIETPYLFQMNEDYNYKIAGLDFTLDNGIRDTLTVYEFTFKALKEGNTTITLINAKLTDSDSYIDTVVLEKEINIEEKQKNIIFETPIVETKEEMVEYEAPITMENKNIKNETKTIKNETNTETKLNVEDKVVEIVENTTQESEKVKTDVIEKKETATKEKENFVKRVQKVFNELFSKLRDLFK